MLMDATPRNAFPSFEPSDLKYSLTLTLIPTVIHISQQYTHTINNMEVDNEGYLIIDRFRESQVILYFVYFI